MSKILIIDDQEINLTTIKAIIQSNIPECNILIAQSGLEGINIAKKEIPDIIILDIMMPDIDGYETCKRLKNDEITKGIPVMMITSNDVDTESRVKGFNIGADAFLSRPIDFIELFTQVKVMLRIREAENNLRLEKELLDEKVKERTKELRKSEQYLRKALKKATESDRLKLAFLTTMSHELRTPLNAIIGISELVDQEMPRDLFEENIMSINSCGTHLLRIIEDLFDISQIETGGIQIHKRRINLDCIMREVLLVIKAEQEKIQKADVNIEFVSSPDTNGILIKTDPPKIKQLLINLLRNALKFTNKGFIRFGSKLELLDGNEMLHFFVEDSGVGIPKDKQNIIFDIFRQGDDSYTREYDGTGIGLSISKKLTELLGGTIDFTSEEGKGSTFSVNLPLERYNIQETESVEVPDAFDFSKHTILIVEDVSESFDFLRLVLRKTKCKILHAKNGAEAIELSMKNPQIDLVLMDISMPIINGFDATREIKKVRPDLPIIAETAYTMDEDRQGAMEAGCDDYLAKPIKINLLYSVISKFIGKNSHTD